MHNWEGSDMEPGMVAIEWSERLPYLPASYWQLAFSHQVVGRTATIQFIHE